jgi:folate-binding protein YgfZ
VSAGGGDGAERARETGALFRLDDAGLISVSGEDRTTWLNGMVTNDVAALSPGRERSGCHTLLLTNRGAIIADLHAVELGDRQWLLAERDAVGPTIAALERFIVADDVTLEDASASHVQWAVEGPAGPRLFEALGVDAGLAPGAGVATEIAGQPVVIVARGVSGEWARQVIVASDAAERVEAAMRDAGAGVDIGVEDASVLEMLRIEAGTPRQGRELDEDVLPAEARLDATIATTKGCYVGQEIVARLRSRGQVNHLLVGLRFEGAEPAVDTPLVHAGKRTGEVTSVVRSPRAGSIGLGFVRREHSDPGTTIDAGGIPAVVVALPFVSPATDTGSSSPDPPRAAVGPGAASASGA